MDVTDLDLPVLVSLAGPAVERLLLSRLDARGHHGLRRSHGYVIQRLVEHEPTIGELADSLGMTQQGASKQVVDLERLGYAERVPSPTDRRVRTVRLTGAGRAVLTAGRSEREDLEAEVAARVGAEAVSGAKLALAALLDLTGVADRVPGRAVPMPGDPS